MIKRILARNQEGKLKYKETKKNREGKKKRRWRKVLYLLAILPVLLAAVILFIFGNTIIRNLTISHTIDIEALTGGLDVTVSSAEYGAEYLYTPKYVTEEEVVITEEGTYVLSGNYQSVHIRAQGTDTVQLVLSQAVIESCEEPAIFAESAGSLVITLEADTENEISDSGDYNLTGTNQNADGTIFSRVPLIINGDGTLSVEGNYSKAIVSKDTLTILGGILNVQAEATAIEGKDSVRIYAGTINITAGADGIRSTNTNYSNKGFVYIAGGDIDIVSGNDGIQAETVVWIEGGIVTAATGGGSTEIENTDMDSMPMGSPDFGNGPFEEMESEESAADSTMTEAFEFEEFAENKLEEEEDAESTRGIKAGKLIYLTGGELKLDCLDDALHSDGSIQISDITASVSTNDDAVHAEDVILVEGGSLTVTQSYEGLEAAYIEINSGTVNVNSADDGINATDGDAMSTIYSMVNTYILHTDNSISLVVNGGYLSVSAQGDGLDSNGDVSINGGTVLVSTYAGGDDTAIDVDGVCTVNGGILAATGASSMEETLSENSTQNILEYYCEETDESGSITILDSDGNTILYFAPEQEYSMFMVSCAELETGETVTVLLGEENENADENGFSLDSEATLTADGNSVEITIESGTTTCGTNMSNMEGDWFDGQNGDQMQEGGFK
ncbi:MAG: carbohydrate-binding domain-containing protein [Clostridiales bacterium]|nr:carbohydrate-binding domain-containing protein [Clostridiales bacterium]